MRTIRYSARFKRDFRREKSGLLGTKLDRIFADAITLLAADAVMPARYVDHALIGDWKDFRDCHLRPDPS